MSKLPLMGIEINTETKAQVLEIIKDRFESGQTTFITTPYSEFFVNAAKNYKFRLALAKSDLALPDGISVLWLAYYLSLPLTARNFYLKILQAFWQLLYTNFQILLAPRKIHSVIPEKISGSDFFWDLGKLADQHNMKVFLLGGYGETPQIVAEKLSAKFKNIAEINFSNMSPDDSKIGETIKAISEFKPDLLITAYGPIKQEIWLAENLQKTQAKIAIGLGGTFDYVAGIKSSPPKWLRRIGLEWLYRLFTQPSRLRRIWTATAVFLLHALRHKIWATMPYRQNVLAVIINKENKIFVARRPRVPSDQSGTDEYWQFPQGGTDPGESKEQALLREIKEETGLSEFLKILGQCQEVFRYSWTNSSRRLLFNSRKHKGQEQTIFFVRYAGSPNAIDFEKFHEKEFDQYKWVDKNQLADTLHPSLQKMLKLVMADLDNYLDKNV